MQLRCFGRAPWGLAFQCLPQPSLGKICPSCLSPCTQFVAMQLLRCCYHFAHQVLQLEHWAQRALACTYCLMSPHTSTGWSLSAAFRLLLAVLIFNPWPQKTKLLKTASGHLLQLPLVLLHLWNFPRSPSTGDLLLVSRHWAQGYSCPSSQAPFQTFMPGAWPQHTASHMRLLTAPCQLEWLSPGLSPVKILHYPQGPSLINISHSKLSGEPAWPMNLSAAPGGWFIDPQPVTAGTESAASM